MRKDGLVYFIRDGDTNDFKIGLTSGDIADRLKSLQTGSKSSLTVYALIRSYDAREIERELHKRFENQRILNEWFELGAEQWINIITYFDIEFFFPLKWERCAAVGPMASYFKRLRDGKFFVEVSPFEDSVIYLDEYNTTVKECELEGLDNSLNLW